jgi:hypothetical protein
VHNGNMMTDRFSFFLTSNPLIVEVYNEKLTSSKGNREVASWNLREMPCLDIYSNTKYNVFTSFPQS